MKKMFLFPAMPYVELVPAAFEAIHRLDNLLYGPAAQLNIDLLPALPFSNDKPLFASNIQVIAFQNGGGVRFLSQTAQYSAPANNQDLFYHFQGVTRDGEYYIVATFPVTSAVLADTSDAGAPLPPGGIPYPYMADPSVDMAPYYAAVTDLLNAQAPITFSPHLDQLDALIQSIEIIP